MAITHAVHAPRVAHRTVHAARVVIAHPGLAGLMRFGLIVRGVIYLLPGVFALRLALGWGGAAITQADAVRMIGHQPFGPLLLTVLASGLAGYALWGVVRVVFDPLQRGRTPAGLARRFGYATSAFAYTGLLVLALRFLAGTTARGSQAHLMARGVLAQPFGAWLLGVVGLCWIAGAGLGEIVMGWSGRFEKDLALTRVGRTERRWALVLGRVGIVARGVVFAVIGVLLVVAAFHANPGEAGGMDDALLALQRQPFGRLLLGAAAIGLIAFGAYSMLCSRWMRMPARSGASRPPPTEVRHGRS